MDIRVADSSSRQLLNIFIQGFAACSYGLSQIGRFVTGEKVSHDNFPLTLLLIKG
jgi:hypothetical protein